MSDLDGNLPTTTTRVVTGIVAALVVATVAAGTLIASSGPSSGSAGSIVASAGAASSDSETGSSVGAEATTSTEPAADSTASGNSTTVDEAATTSAPAPSTTLTPQATSTSPPATTTETTSTVPATTAPPFHAPHTTTASSASTTAAPSTTTTEPKYSNGQPPPTTTTLPPNGPQACNLANLDIDLSPVQTLLADMPVAVNLTISNPTATTCLLGPSLGLKIGQSSFGQAIAGVDAELAPGGSTTRAIVGQMRLEPATYASVLFETRSSISFETTVNPLPPCTPADVLVEAADSLSANWYTVSARGTAGPCRLVMTLAQVDFFDPATGDAIGTDAGPFVPMWDVVVGAQLDADSECGPVCADAGSTNPFKTTIGQANVILTFDINGQSKSIGPYSVGTWPPES